MTNQHLITPPPEMVEKWVRMLEFLPDKQVFSEVARWGADQELEACVEGLVANKWFLPEGRGLTAFRAALAQPEPVGPTRKEAADLYSEVMAAHDCQTLGEMAEHFARAVLARWGTPANPIREEI